jgi:hypothetical protein
VTDAVIAYDSSSDDEVCVALGAALLGSPLNVSPADRARLGRFARQWLDSKVDHMWQRLRDTETYRIWAATAGTGQVVEADLLTEMLHEDGIDEPVAAPAAVLMSRRAAATSEEYDVAVSCAHPELDYVGQVVSCARALGLRVFHDHDMTLAWWGRNFIVEGRKIYGQRTRHFVPFLSVEYLVETRPRDAFEAALVVAVERGDDYILPVVIGNVRVPPQLLHPHIGVLRAEEYPPPVLAGALLEKVAASKARGVEARDLGTIVRSAGPLLDEGDDLLP